jgi:hypothetical protein
MFKKEIPKSLALPYHNFYIILNISPSKTMRIFESDCETQVRVTENDLPIYNFTKSWDGRVWEKFFDIEYQKKNE